VRTNSNRIRLRRFFPQQILRIDIPIILLMVVLGACSNGVDDDSPPKKPPTADGGGAVGTTPGAGSGSGSGSGNGGGGSSPVLGSDPNDRDGDGLPLAWEVQYGLSDTDPSDAYLDSDNDFLNNRSEYQLNLDPTNADSDADGVPDGVEVDIQTDPAIAGNQVVVTVCANGCDYNQVSAALAAGNQYVRVKPGNYTDNIVLGQSRHVFSEAGAKSTVIKAALVDRVVSMSANSSLHGFTISGGKAALGGGIYAAPLAVVIRGNIIAGNEAVVDANNINSGYGGGIYINSQGNAAYTVRIVDNEIRDNTALWGAGVDLSDYSYAILSANRIHDNHAIAAPASTGLASLEPLGGGAFLSEYAYSYCFNNVFYANESRGGKGGGIYSGFNNVVLNNTIVANSALLGSGLSSTSVLIGNIIWSNVPKTESVDAVLVMHYSIVDGGFADGLGNLDSDPLFVNADTFDYRLQKESPAVDAGSSAACNGDSQFVRCVEAAFINQLVANQVDLNKDLIGVSRALDGDGGGAVSGDGSDYDMGAHEFIPPPL